MVFILSLICTRAHWSTASWFSCSSKRTNSIFLINQDHHYILWKPNSYEATYEEGRHMSSLLSALIISHSIWIQYEEKCKSLLASAHYVMPPRGVESSPCISPMPSVAQQPLHISLSLVARYSREWFLQEPWRCTKWYISAFTPVPVLLLTQYPTVLEPY